MGIRKQRFKNANTERKGVITIQFGLRGFDYNFVDINVFCNLILYGQYRYGVDLSISETSLLQPGHLYFIVKSSADCSSI